MTSWDLDCIAPCNNILFIIRDNYVNTDIQYKVSCLDDFMHFLISFKRDLKRSCILFWI